MVQLVSEVVTLVASILPLVSLFQVFDGNAAVTAGILRARGKQVDTVYPTSPRANQLCRKVTGAILNMRSVL